MSYLSADCEEQVRRFVADHVRNVSNFGQNARAIGWLNDISEKEAVIVGGVVLEMHTPWDCWASVAVTPACRPTRDHVRALFRVAFEGFDAKRMTCHIARKNTRARRLAENCGFRQEGALRRGYDGTQTAIIYGMTRDECQWLTE